MSPAMRIRRDRRDRERAVIRAHGGPRAAGGLARAIGGASAAAAGRAARWRALASLLLRAGRWRVAAFAALVLVTGLLPTGIILATGALARAVPAVVAHGAGSAQARPAVLALAEVVASLAALAAAGGALAYLARVLDAAFALEVNSEVAAAMLGTPGLEPLEDPALADDLQAVRDAERRDVLRRTAASLSEVGATRLRGLGALAVLLAFRWWAPLVLLAAWQLTNLLYLRATEAGVSFDMGDGAVRLRRSEYIRSLAVDAPAAKEVRVFGLGRWMVARYGEAWLDALGVMWHSRRASRGLTAATALALALAHAAVLGALVQSATHGRVGMAALLVFAQAAIASADLGMIGDAQYFLAQSLALAGRVAAVRARIPASPDEPRAQAPPAAARGGPAVSLRDVRFTYRGRAEPTLDGLTLDVPAGQSLAIVGRNGAGKSTLVKLLCGLYQPQAGHIALDGGVSPLRARGRIGVIFQDFVRYPLPLRENVGFGALPLLGDARALGQALRDAGGGELPARLPRGWDTVLSREFEGGADLSGGQWQRVALARALAAVRGGAGLLILDEPTASLDVRAETELFERFLEVTRGVTTILVSHRLSSVRRADRIVVIDGGRVVEDGTHDALLAAGGAYAEMFALQAARFAEPARPGAEEAAHA